MHSISPSKWPNIQLNGAIYCKSIQNIETQSCASVLKTCSCFCKMPLTVPFKQWKRSLPCQSMVRSPRLDLIIIKQLPTIQALQVMEAAAHISKTQNLKALQQILIKCLKCIHSQLCQADSIMHKTFMIRAEWTTMPTQATTLIISICIVRRTPRQTSLLIEPLKMKLLQ